MPEFDLDAALTPRSQVPVCWRCGAAMAFSLITRAGIARFSCIPCSCESEVLIHLESAAYIDGEAIVGQPLETLDHKCPGCESDEFEAVRISMEGDQVVINQRCGMCDNEWAACYRLEALDA